MKTLHWWRWGSLPDCSGSSVRRMSGTHRHDGARPKHAGSGRATTAPATTPAVEQQVILTQIETIRTRFRGEPTAQ